MSELEDVAAVADLPEGTMLGVTLSGGEPVCVFNHRGVIGAVGNLCTHAEFLISDGVLHGDGTLECIFHGARFDCRTGAVKRHPAERPLPVYEARSVAGRVLVAPSPALPSERTS
ncbi:MAG: Rieske 2Fe-2S domain-containing protein [Gemmatimonadota bacterium]|nr:Rieske 2Fe-2S domain-containing protein [Gemmatimonadota bacterium]